MFIYDESGSCIGQSDDSLYQKLVSLLLPYSPVEREQALQLLRERICFSCGREQSDGCLCWWE